MSNPVPEKTEKMRAIKDEIVTLTESPLYEYRTSNGYFPVIGEGSHDARIMFIGEAPGENEAKTGRPFCGASGRVLDEMLASINLDRKAVYVTNIVKDRPPKNRDPRTDEIISTPRFWIARLTLSSRMSSPRWAALVWCGF